MAELTDNKTLAAYLHFRSRHVAKVPQPDPEEEKNVICLLVAVTELPKVFYEWINDRLDY